MFVDNDADRNWDITVNFNDVDLSDVDIKFIFAIVTSLALFTIPYF